MSRGLLLRFRGAFRGWDAEEMPSNRREDTVTRECVRSEKTRPPVPCNLFPMSPNTCPVKKTLKPKSEQSKRYLNETNGPNNQPQEKGPRKPKCAKCRNHGIISNLKGHKRHCEYKDYHRCRLRRCRLLPPHACHKCDLTTDRRQIMAKNVRQTRHQDDDRKRRESLTDGEGLGNNSEEEEVETEEEEAEGVEKVEVTPRPPSRGSSVASYSELNEVTLDDDLIALKNLVERFSVRLDKISDFIRLASERVDLEGYSRGLDRTTKIHQEIGALLEVYSKATMALIAAQAARPSLADRVNERPPDRRPFKAKIPPKRQPNSCADCPEQLSGKTIRQQHQISTKPAFRSAAVRGYDGVDESHPRHEGVSAGSRSSPLNLTKSVDNPHCYISGDVPPTPLTTMSRAHSTPWNAHGAPSRPHLPLTAHPTPQLHPYNLPQCYPSPPNSSYTPTSSTSSTPAPKSFDMESLLNGTRQVICPSVC